MKLKVIIHPEPEGGFSAAVPALPGCLTCADTLDELRANIREAILGYLEAGEDQNPFTTNDTTAADFTEEIEL
jgi:predicted RNase H-like HicB family nuclease